MGISRMLKVQLLGHSAIRDEVKRTLREAGVIEITETSLEVNDAGGQPRDVRELESRLEQAQGALEFLDEFAPKLSFMEKVSAVPLEASIAAVEKIEAESPVEVLGEECARLQSEMRSGREELERSIETVSMLEPWAGLEVDLGRLSTAGYELQLWTLDEKSQGVHLDELRREFELADFSEFARTGGSIYLTIIVARRESTRILERMKETGAHHHSWEHLEGSPSAIISAEKEKWADYRERIGKARGEAVKLAERSLDDLRLLADHYREEIGLVLAENSFYTTASTFVLEGWVRAVDRPALEKSLSAGFEEIELSFRDPLPDEKPPIYLDNRGLGKPYEFVTTLYGRPTYGEFDPTPLLAPFFILFFAMCLTDAGYGLTLSAIAAVILMKFKPSGGAGLLMKVLFMGGLVTAVVGIVAGGFFGISAGLLPKWLQNFIFIDPLREPMKMLNISFIMGLVHMVFGMGVKMAANLKARLIADAILDDLVWMIFLVALAPLGYAGILGGSVAPGIMTVSVWTVGVLAAIIFFTGGRHQKGLVKKMLTGLVKFYDVVGYFGDVLSYARLLALGLATSAIAIAVNDIAAMVKGMPFYTGYIVMVLILVGGHTFNLAVNTLGAFVHSGRLQYLEFFSKFFTGGGREFRPFKTERRFSIMKKTEDGS